MTSNLGKRVFKHGFVLATTFLTCTALQADHNDPHSTATFIQKAAMGGQMEVQMGQLAQQKGQAQEVKSLGATLVRDHTQANQRLQQLASTKNITLDNNLSTTSADQSATHPSASATTSTDATGKHHANAEFHAGRDKHQKELQKLQSQSGTEFDKAFVRMAIKDHKKDISEFEKARTDITDPEIKAFIDESLPKLRNHLQMAKSAARTVGVDESTIVSDRDDDNDKAVGSAAPGATGTTRGSDKSSSLGSDKEHSSLDNSQRSNSTTDTTRGSDKPSSPASNPANKERSSLDSSERYNGATDTDASGTIRHNTSSQAELDASAGDHSVSASTDLNTSNPSVSTDITTEKKHKVFEKGDGKVLGLSTDKHDGKFLGIIPDPIKHKDKGASVNADVDVNGHEASVGGSASTESGSSSTSSSSSSDSSK